MKIKKRIILTFLCVVIITSMIHKNAVDISADTGDPEKPNEIIQITNPSHAEKNIA